jgi:hypothetical protein
VARGGESVISEVLVADGEDAGGEREGEAGVGAEACGVGCGAGIRAIILLSFASMSAIAAACDRG